MSFLFAMGLATTQLRPSTHLPDNKLRVQPCWAYLIVHTPIWLIFITVSQTPEGVAIGQLFDRNKNLSVF